MTQKDAVFSVVAQVLAQNNIPFQVGSTNVASILTRELRAQINSKLENDFNSNSIELSDDAKSKLNDPTSLRAYISGLVSNWLRKDPRLNGGTVVATTPAALQAGVMKSDPQLKALRRLYSVQVEPARKVEIQGFIDKRIAELSKRNTT